MAEKFKDPFENASDELVEAATEVNRASELTNTNRENSIGTMINQRYTEGALTPKENGEQ